MGVVINSDHARKNKIMVKLKRKVEYCLEGDRISIGARKYQVSELFPSSILCPVFKCSLSGFSPLVISATKSLSHFWVSFGVLFFILFSKKCLNYLLGKLYPSSFSAVKMI